MTVQSCGGRATWTALIAGMALGLAFGGGCAKPMLTEYAGPREIAGQAALPFDIAGDAAPELFALHGPEGRTQTLAYDADGDGTPDETLDLAAVRTREAPHVAIVLDGVPFEVVEALYAEGGLRLFHPPVPVVAPFPAMTDIALADLFGTAPIPAYEARYYDRDNGHLAGGDWRYISLVNEPWVAFLDLRSNILMDAMGYLSPRWAFGSELGGLADRIRKRTGRDLDAYLVATAGIATADAARGIRDELRTLDRFVHQMTWEMGGQMHVTLLADHGHTLTPCERVDWTPWLRERGWHVTTAVEAERDVAPIEYGLVTYASFACGDPAGLAADMADHESVEVAVWAEGDAVVVVAPGGERARVERRGNRYRYEAACGDPLKLAGALAALRAAEKLDADGFAASQDWLAATADAVYPDAPARLWRSLHTLVRNPPDVVASLKASYCSGAAGKAFWVSPASTHGDLGRGSGITFLMTTLGPLEPHVGEAGALRSRDVAPILSDLLGRPWPGLPVKEEPK